MIPVVTALGIGVVGIGIGMLIAQSPKAVTWVVRAAVLAPIGYLILKQTGYIE